MSTKVVPKSHQDIVSKILHHGRFKEALDYLTYMLKSETSTSIIIRGSVGIGKTSLVREAIKKCDVIDIWLRPTHYTEDFSALRHIATELKLNPRDSLSEILEDLEERCLGTDKRIVICLPDFEEFCRKRQSLLYCLTHLTQHGVNISLIGLTYSLDCTEHLEKRVRSRINAEIYNLKPPYENFEDYLEFAKLLLGGHKINKELELELETMFMQGQRDIRTLKRQLIFVCTWPKGKLVVGNPVKEHNQDHMCLLEQRVKWLVKPQLDILMMAMNYCYSFTTNDFRLSELDEYGRRKCKKFDAISHVAIRNASFLVKNSFFIQIKRQQFLDRNSLLTLNILPYHFRKIMANNPDLHHVETDNLWKRLR